MFDLNDDYDFVVVGGVRERRDWWRGGVFLNNPLMQCVIWNGAKVIGHKLMVM